jgi:hypothetical protein
VPSARVPLLDVNLRRVPGFGSKGRVRRGYDSYPFADFSACFRFRTAAILKSGEHLVRYRTAAILSALLIGGMFGLPATVKAVFLPSLERGYLDPVLGWEQLILIARYQ